MDATTPIQSRGRTAAGRALTAERLAAFASLMLPVTAAQMPIAVYVPSIFAQHYALPLTILGALFLGERIWGIFTDPLIGMLSDRTRSRFGRRKPWIVAGAALYAMATVFLFFPDVIFIPVTPVYLGVTLFAFYLAWSMIQIPYLAWSGEVSGEYHERTRIAMYQTVSAAISLLVVLLLPTVIDQVSPKNAVLKLAAMGAVILVSLPVTLWLTLRAFEEPARPVTEKPRLSLRASFAVIMRENALLRVLFSDLAVSTGQLIRASLFLFFVTIYMGLPKWGSGLFLLQFVFGIVAGPLWAVVARRFGKHRTAVAGELTQVVVNVLLLATVPGQLPLLLGLTVAQGLAQGSGNLMLRSMVADVADRQKLETGEDHTALFFSVFSISSKGGMAIGAGLALSLVAWFGFDPARVNTPAALHGLALVFALGPAVCHLISAVLVYGFPIDERKHIAIREALEARTEEPS